MKKLKTLKVMSTCLLAVAILVAAVLILTPKAQAATIVESGTCGANLTWTLDTEGTLTISGTGAMYNYEAEYYYDCEANDWIYNEGAVCAPWGWARSVIIDDGVTSIGSYAFGVEGLTSLTIGNSLTTIASDAFYGGGHVWESSLTDLYITNPSAWCKISGGVCFAEEYTIHILDAEGNEVPRVVLDSTVTKIPSCAFSNCVNLTEITIPKSVNQIGYSAFDGCWRLNDVYYAGTENQWNGISIGSDNSYLTGATRYYNHIHDYTLIPAVTVDSTCTERGYVEYTCVWGETYRDDYVPALGHIIGDNAVVTQPTCTTQGYTTSSCTRCGTMLTTDYTSSLGHDYSGPEVTVEPTCTESGYAGKTCIHCGDNAQTTYFDATGHKMVLAPAVAPTCTEPGLSAGSKCEYCGLPGIVQNEQPALGHKEAVLWPVAPTCTKTGVTEGKYCSVCNEVLVAQEVIPAHGHNMTTDFSYNDATGHWNECKTCGFEEGFDKHNLVEGECTVCKYGCEYAGGIAESGTCGDNLTWTLDDKGTLTISGVGPMYDYDSWEGYTPWYSNHSVIKALVINDGVTSIGQCAFFSCDNLTAVSIPNGITKIGWAAFAGCNNLEYNIYNNTKYLGNAKNPYVVLMDVLADSITHYEIPAQTKIIYESAFYSCSMTTVTIPNSVTCIGMWAFGEDPGHVLVYYGGTQTQWNCIYGKEELSAATIHYNHIHNYALFPVVVVESTCTEDGYKEYTCIYGDKYKEVYAPALGHDFCGEVTVVAPTCMEQGYTKTNCTCCDAYEAYNYIDELGHSMVYNPAVAPTCTEPGLSAGSACKRCSFIGVEQKEVSPANGHSFVGGVCTACGGEADVKIAGVTLRPSCSGLYFKGSFNFDKDLQVARYGIAVSLYNRRPVADDSDSSSLYTIGENSVLISNILGGDGTGGKAWIFARAYALLEDGTYIYGQVVITNLQSVVETLDAQIFDGLGTKQKTALTDMYRQYTAAMQDWLIPKIKELV